MSVSKEFFGVRPDWDTENPTGGPGGNYAYIGGNVSGQVIAGNQNYQVQQASAQPAVISEEERDSLRRQFQALRTLIEREAPAGTKELALQRAAELEAALLDQGVQPKTLTKMEYIRDWFIEQLPAIAGTVGSLVVHPLVGRLVEAGGDALIAEFKRRFGA